MLKNPERVERGRVEDDAFDRAHRPPASPAKLLTAQEAAKLVGVHPNTVYLAAASGQLRCHIGTARTGLRRDRGDVRQALPCAVPRTSALPARPWPGSSSARSVREPALAGGSFIVAADGGEHLGEVAESVALIVELVGPSGDRNRLAGQALGLSVLAAMRVDTRLYLPPDRICLLRPDLAPELSQRLSFGEPPQDTEPAAEPRSV
jgi:hypothetical protein